MIVTKDAESMSISDTLGNQLWLQENALKLAETFPATWTHFHNHGPLEIGPALNLLGIHWESEGELARILAWCEKNEFLERNGELIRRSPEYTIALKNDV